VAPDWKCSPSTVTLAPPLIEPVFGCTPWTSGGSGSPLDSGLDDDEFSDDDDELEELDELSDGYDDCDESDSSSARSWPSAGGDFFAFLCDFFAWRAGFLAAGLAGACLPGWPKWKAPERVADVPSGLVTVTV